MGIYWEAVNGERLAQGDMLPACSVPVIPPNFDSQSTDAGAPSQLEVHEYDLIIMTQSCDLEHNKAPLVACCPIHTILDFEKVSPAFCKVGEWDRVRQGRVEGLHLLSSPRSPEDKWQAMVVDFRSIFSLPVGYMQARAKAQKERWRLRSPFLEHFSQAFARFFMRVGLPSAIESYNKEPKRPHVAPAPQSAS